MANVTITMAEFEIYTAQLAAHDAKFMGPLSRARARVAYKAFRVVQADGVTIKVETLQVKARYTAAPASAPRHHAQRH